QRFTNLRYLILNHRRILNTKCLDEFFDFRAPSPRGPQLTPALTRGIPSDGPFRAGPLFAYAASATLAFSAPSKGRAMRCTLPGFTKPRRPGSGTSAVSRR